MFDLRRTGPLGLLMVLLLSIGNAWAGSSVLIWPVDPVLAADQQATALWLENKGDAPVNLQVRVLAWEQQGLDDQYQNQRDVVGIPQVARVEAGQKQLIRITRLRPAPPAVQQAFRIVIDELPGAAPAADAGQGAVRFSMRYLVPLFAYGAGLRSDKPGPQAAGQAAQEGPVLRWRQVSQDGSSYIQLHNSGRVHARLTDGALEQDGKRQVLFPGLMGYVLPGATMRWPLSKPVAAGGVFWVHVNGATQPAQIDRE